MTACKFKVGDLVYAPFHGYKDSNLKITVVKRRHNHRKLLNRFIAFLKGE